jgi:hypothetical protein
MIDYWKCALDGQIRVLYDSEGKSAYYRLSELYTEAPSSAFNYPSLSDFINLEGKGTKKTSIYNSPLELWTGVTKKLTGNTMYKIYLSSIIFSSHKNKDFYNVISRGCRLVYFLDGLGRMPIVLQMMFSITSSAPPPIEISRISLNQ